MIVTEAYGIYRLKTTLDVDPVERADKLRNKEVKELFDSDQKRIEGYGQSRSIGLVATHEVANSEENSEIDDERT